MSAPAPAVATMTAWDTYWARVGNEDWLAVKALLEVDPHRTVARDAAQWIRDRGDGALMDWDAWLADVDTRGRGWSSTEHRLFQLAASLIDPDRPVRLVGVLDRMGSWETKVWQILVNWGTGGNNRDLPGRSWVVSNR